MRCPSTCLLLVGVLLVLLMPGLASGTWQQVGLGGYNVPEVVFRVGDSDTAFAAVNAAGEGVYRSIDGGLTWTLSGSLPQGVGVATGHADREVVYSIHREAIYRSLDGGDSWQPIGEDLGFNSDYGPQDVRTHPSDADTVYLTTLDFTGGGALLRSEDGGDSWSPMVTPWADGKICFALHSLNPARLLLAVSWTGPLGRSTDGGAGWTGVLAGVADDVALDPVSQDIIFAAVDGSLKRSSDGGDSWITVDSDDGLELNSVYAVAVNPVNPAVVYAGGWGGMYVSSDGGSQWTALSDGLPGDVLVECIGVEAEHGEIILLGTASHGIYRHNYSLAGIDPAQGSDFPEEHAIGISPNPFSREVAISFNVPKESHTSVIIYDINGRLVRRLMSSRVNAGTHTISWDATDDGRRRVASGIYFAVLSSDHRRDVRSIVITR